MKTKLWILGCVICAACGGDQSKPDHILSKDRMVGVLIDVQLAQTRVNDLRLKADSAQEVYDYYQEYLLEQHTVEDSAFYESLSYYLNRPIELNEIHEGILDTLNLRLQRIEAQEEKDKKDKAEKDSLKNLDVQKDLKEITPKEL
jgi:hypothetical protein